MDSINRFSRLTVPASAFNACYLPHLLAPQRTQIFFGGAGSGKSVFLAGRCALDAMAGRSTLVVRKVARTLRSSCFAEIGKGIERFGLSGAFTLRREDMTVTCGASGAQILLCGLDDVEKVKSITPQRGALTDVWVEEATEVALRDVKQLDKRLRGQSPHPKRLTLSFNPVSRAHWLYREYFADFPEDKGILVIPDLLILRTTHRDNRFLTPGDREALEGERDGYFRQVYTLGEWGEAGGTVLTGWKVGEPPRDFPREELRCGVDFGFSQDPCAAVLLRYDARHRRIYALSEICERGLTNDRLAAKLRDMAGNIPVHCDSAEPKSIAELRQCGIHALPARKGPDSLAHGLRWLMGQEIVISPRCFNLREELMGYRWKPDGQGGYLPLPEGADHLIDAMRYALEGDAAHRSATAVGR